MGHGTVKGEVMLQNDSGTPVDSLSITSTSKRFKLTLKEVKKGHTYKVDIEALPELRLTHIAETVDLLATLGKSKIKINFNTHLALKRRVEAMPKWLIFQHRDTQLLDKEPGEKPKRIVKIKGAEGIDFTIEKITTKGDFFIAELKKQDTRKKPCEYDLAVTITKRPEGAALSSKGQLEIHTNDPIEKKINLNVMAFYKKNDTR